MARHILLLILLLATACDQKPATSQPLTAEEKALEQDKKERELEAPKVRNNEGKTFYGVHLVADVQVFFAHIRRDCPAHQKDLKEKSPVPPYDPTYEEVVLTVRNARFV